MWVGGCRAVNVIPKVPAFLEITYWAGSEIKIMQLNKCIHRKKKVHSLPVNALPAFTGNGDMKKIKEVS